MGYRSTRRPHAAGRGSGVRNSGRWLWHARLLASPGFEGAAARAGRAPVREPLPDGARDLRRGRHPVAEHPRRLGVEEFRLARYQGARRVFGRPSQSRYLEGGYLFMPNQLQPGLLGAVLPGIGRAHAELMRRLPSWAAPSAGSTTSSRGALDRRRPAANRDAAHRRQRRAAARHVEEAGPAFSLRSRSARNRFCSETRRTRASSAPNKSKPPCASCRLARAQRAGRTAPGRRRSHGREPAGLGGRPRTPSAR